MALPQRIQQQLDQADQLLAQMANPQPVESLETITDTPVVNGNALEAPAPATPQTAPVPAPAP